MQSENDNTKMSKLLSLVLRHKPQQLGIELDDQGWTSIEFLIEACQRQNIDLTLDWLNEIVQTNSKNRFVISTDGKCIRAQQGHSVDVELGYETAIPPITLYHGTGTHTVEDIRKSGILKMQRHHVHLSADIGTAIQVGSRHGKPFVLTVRSLEMHINGFLFYQTGNGVWLTETVPPQYLD